MRFIPEYAPARKLILSFVAPFYNTRFHYGRAHAEIIRACRDVEVEMHLAPDEMDAFRAAVGEEVMALPHLTLNPKCPGTAIMLEAAPIFVESEDDQGNAEGDANRFGLVFWSPTLEDPEAVHAFIRWLAEQHGFTPLELGFNFATARLLVNEAWCCFPPGSSRPWRMIANCATSKKIFRAITTISSQRCTAM